MCDMHQCQLRWYRSARRGFTLIELLVVIAVIAVLVALLLPAIQQAREAARRSQCKSQLKQIGLALHNYYDSHRAFPPGAKSDPTIMAVAGSAVPDNKMSWIAMILPQLEQNAIYQQIQFDHGWWRPENSPAYDIGIPVLKCPSWSPNNSSSVNHHYSYRGVAGARGSHPNGGTYSTYPGTSGFGGGDYVNNGMLHLLSSVRFRDVTDGSSNTLFVGELAGRDSTKPAWIIGTSSTVQSSHAMKNIEYHINADVPQVHQPAPNEKNHEPFQSQHAGGTHFLLVDGAIRFLSENISLALYKSLASRGGVEVIGEF